MTSSHRHFDRAFGVELSADIAKIFMSLMRLGCDGRNVVANGIDGSCTVDELDDFGQCADRVDRHTFNDGSFPRIAKRYEQVRNFAIPGQHGDGQDAFHRTELSVQRKFANHQIVGYILLRQQAVAAQNADSHRKVEGRAFFLHIGWAKVDYDTLVRSSKAVVTDCREDSIPGFAHSSIRQTNDHDLPISASRDVHFDIDEVRFDAINSSTASFEKHCFVMGLGRGKLNVVRGRCDFKTKTCSQ